MCMIEGEGYLQKIIILTFITKTTKKDFKVLKTFFLIHQKFVLNLNDFYRYQVNF